MANDWNITSRKLLQLERQYEMFGLYIWSVLPKLIAEPQIQLTYWLTFTY